MDAEEQLLLGVARVPAEFEEKAEPRHDERHSDLAGQTQTLGRALRRAAFFPRPAFQQDFRP
ncbi:hypothetical protein [Streptomyces olivaceus]|uniref:hypothetical protein n=1 Tax=Streptomyces olivaceus TaxID=47716 RepID=UPI0022EF02DE|nr:hypothetical protein [Streptomyces olivaceus]GHI97992.1 hypothetical protein TPA0905_74630 [Streptomyces olivaceus]